MQGVAHHTGDCFDVCLVEVPTQNEIDIRLQYGSDVRAFGVMKPIKRMMNQRDLQRSAQLL